MEDYKRLTEKEEDWFDTNLHSAEVYNRLAELEDKIENGTLIELPCKVGDTIYYIGSLEVRAFFKIKTLYDIVAMPFSLDMLDGYKNVWFLTKAEAEAKLKELLEVQNER